MEDHWVICDSLLYHLQLLNSCILIFSRKPINFKLCPSATRFIPSKSFWRTFNLSLKNRSIKQRVRRKKLIDYEKRYRGLKWWTPIWPLASQSTRLMCGGNWVMTLIQWSQTPGLALPVLGKFILGGHRRM